MRQCEFTVDVDRMSGREVGAVPPGHLSPGPPFFAHSSGDALAVLLRAAGLRDVAVRPLSFVHWVGSPNELWDGVLGGTVRTAALVRAQPPDVQRRIRAAFDRAAVVYAVDDGLGLPVSVKIASGMR
jgi:hypothetical protein